MDGTEQVDFTAVVLAGGRSKRMGRDKALIRVGGRTLVERSLAVLRGLFDEVLIVGGPVDRFAGLDVDAVFEDDTSGLGPIGGVLTGLRWMKNDGAFFTACDMPNMSEAAIGALLEVARDDFAGGGVDAVVPEIEGRLEPLHAVYSRSCVPAIEKQIAAGDLRVYALADIVRARRWDPVAAGIRLEAFLNVNAPEDLAGLEGSRP